MFSNLSYLRVLWFSSLFGVSHSTAAAVPLLSIQAASFSSPSHWWWRWQGVLFHQHAAEMCDRISILLLLGNLSRLCLCFALVCRNAAAHTKYPLSVLALCSHCKAVLDAVLRAHREPEHLSTAQQWLLAQSTDSTNPSAQTSLSPLSHRTGIIHRQSWIKFKSRILCLFSDNLQATKRQNIINNLLILKQTSINLVVPTTHNFKQEN